MIRRKYFSLAVASLASGSTGVYYFFVRSTEWDDVYRERFRRFSSFLTRNEDVDHWRLLRLAHSKNLKIRQLGIATIAKSNLSDWKKMYIARLSDPSVVAALILKGIPLENFLPRSVPLSEKGTLDHEMHKLLEKLNTPSLDPCVKFYTELALHTPPPVYTDEELALCWSGADDCADPKRMSERPDVNRLYYYAKALEVQSTLPSQCSRIVDELGLDLLMRLWKIAETVKESEVQLRTLVLKVLANVALQNDLKPSLLQTGWLSVVKNYLASSQLQYNLLSNKILHNVASDLDCEPKFEHNVYLLHGGEWSGEAPTIDIVFIHGLRGSVFWTWRQKDKSQLLETNDQKQRTRCWPKDWLPYDVKGNVRVLAVDYASSISDWVEKCDFENVKNSLDARSIDLLTKLRKAGVGDRPVIWVGHSMGGIFVKKILCHLENNSEAPDLPAKCDRLLDNTAGCVFYSAPHFGSPVASKSVASRYRYFLLPSVEVNELRENSPYLINLHADFQRIVKNRRIEIVNFGETLKSKFPFKLFLLVVPPDQLTQGGVGGRIYLLNESHFNTCKPSCRSAVNYRVLVDFVNEILENVEKYS